MAPGAIPCEVVPLDAWHDRPVDPELTSPRLVCQMQVRAVRGMKDILPDQSWRWQRLEAAFRRVVEAHGYGEVRTPLLEATDLFVRQIGEDTDVVAKEMYSFERHGDALTVRPEGTAGVARAYVQHAVQAREPVSRWYYLGAMFRAERPAKGRFRQFYQAGCEVFGDPGPIVDAELVAMTAEIVEALGIREYRVHLNSLGSPEARARYRSALRTYLEPLANGLSEDSRRRLDSNPLRILDSKSPADADAIAGAPSILEQLDASDAAHFERICRLLDVLGVRYEVDSKLVRGLDYYTGTLFELQSTTGELGAQAALLGGGRYDAMVEGLGGPKVPAIGFAMGLERLLEVMPGEEAPPAIDAIVLPLGAEAQTAALTIARRMRVRGLRVEVDGRGVSLRAMLRRANGSGAPFAVLLGEDELRGSTATVKDLRAHEQHVFPVDGLADELAARLPRAGAPELAEPGHATEARDDDA